MYSLVYRDRGDTEYLVKAVAADSVLIISMMNFKTEKSADVSLKPSDIVKASDGAEAEEDSSLAVQTPEEETKSLRRENKDLSNRHMWWRQKM